MNWIRKHWSTLVWTGLGAAFLLFLTWVPSKLVESAFESGSAPTQNSADGGEPRQDPGQVDDAFVAHIQAGQYAKAYALMTTAYQSTVPLRDFEHAVSRNAYLKGSREIGCGSITDYQRGAHVRRGCILSTATVNVYAELYYAMEEGEWRITGILIGGTPALPGFAFLPPPPAEAVP